MTHPHDHPAFLRQQSRAGIGTGRPWEPLDALVACWAGAVASDIERGRLDRPRRGYGFDAHGLPTYTARPSVRKEASENE